MNFKKQIADQITLNIENVDFESMLSAVQDTNFGDYCIPCFPLAKILHKSPIMVAQDIQNSLRPNSLIAKTEIVNGYLNFYLNKQTVIDNILRSVKQEDFYGDNEYFGKTICFDYSSANLAKYMHIGHLSTTIIGESIARICQAKGYNVVRINYIGDCGTPFGKMMYAHLNWGSEQELEKNGVDYLQDMYVEFCKRAENDESLEEQARYYFKKIEDKDPVIYPIYEKFIQVSKLEAKDILDTLGVQFDSWKGESAYVDEMNNVLTMLSDKNILKDSEGAKIVDLSDYNLGVYLVQKSDGASLYATRDISAAIDRYNEYHFDKMLYVTAVQQKLHFEQLFKVLELLGYDFSKDLKHIYYGMLSLPTGKIASRKGKQATLRDLMKYAYDKVLKIVENRDFKIETKHSVATKIAMSALKYSALKNERIKDTVFDVENCFSFDGDTSAYMQYCYARISSILRKAGDISFENVDFSYLNNDDCYPLVMAINNYKDKLNMSLAQYEPSVLCKYTLDLCKMFNKFYVNQKVITENTQEMQAKIYLLTILKNTLKNLFNLICIDTIEEM